ncbi:MAG: hypothetical protein GTN80_02490 [Nitrososphaeria archaeon]|nr:hypothetical protein [Nitrososphaeria archaeon]NIN52043.1 hypothetical protein [Nitrososphaeria archaeon]NIQ32504.1 hypothetical protein [Nitrososphaeria archaeon]
MVHSELIVTLQDWQPRIIEENVLQKELGNIPRPTKPINYREGLNLFYRLAGMGTLKYMNKFPSIDSKKVIYMIRKTIHQFKRQLEGVRQNPSYLSYEVLRELGLLKEKHIYYASYLAAVSSFPILYQVDDEDITDAMLAKMAFVLSIKALDNISDQLHTFDQAVKAMQKYDVALTSEIFDIESECKGEISRAQNTTFLIARWTYDIIARSIDKSLDMFRAYIDDAHKFDDGQISSMYQKVDGKTGEVPDITVKDYLKTISEKSVGALWLDIDLCFYEKNFEVQGMERKGIELYRKGIDYVYKSSLIYDDAQDIIPDLEDNIVNIAVLQGAERGACSIDDVKTLTPRALAQKLEKNGSIMDTIYLADLVFLKGIDYLIKAKNYLKRIDIDATVFGSRFLRAFNLRKWTLKRKNLHSTYIFLASFDRFDSIKASIPSHVLEYGKYL